MSLDPFSKTLAAGRPAHGVSDPRPISARQPEGAGRDDLRTKDRMAFADLMRVRQLRADQAEAQSRVDADEKSKQPPASVAAQDPPSDEKVQDTASRVQEVPSQDGKSADGVALNFTVSEADTVAVDVTPEIPQVTKAVEPETPGQALLAAQTLPSEASVSDLIPADVASDPQVAGLVQALNDLKSALKAQVTGKASTESRADTVETKESKPAEPTLTDAQLNQLMQALLSGKPLTPELKSLSETPKVAEALKAVRGAMAVLEPKRPDAGPVAEAMMALIAETETADGQGGKVSDEAKTLGGKADEPFGELLGAKPTASPTLKTDAGVQTSVVQTASETVATQTTPADLAAKLVSKPSETPVDVKPAPVDGDNHTPIASPAAVRAAENLQLARSEAALGSGLSTTALNNLTHMSAQIARHMTAKSTQFNMELHPADMGRVDVKLSLNHDGTMSAALSFDSPVAESQFRAQADELRRQLEAQGFQLSDSALSFSSRQGSDQASRQGTPDTPAFTEDKPDASRATQAFGALEHTLDMPAPGALLAQKLGLDLLGAQTYRLSLNVTA